MSRNITKLSKRVDDALAEVRALKITVQLGGISYDKAKMKADKLLKVVNIASAEIAKKYGRKYREIKFVDL
jgi:intracellular sulfur oxidation DsrE/DsrF family protein